MTDTEIETALGLTTPVSAENEALLQLAVSRAEAAIRAFLRTDFGVRVYQELKPGHGYPNPRGVVQYPYLSQNSGSMNGSRYSIVLNNIPVHNDGSMQVFYDRQSSGGQRTGAFGTEDILVQGIDWFLDVDDAVNNISNNGVIHFRDGIGNIPRDIKVIYKAGQIDPVKLADFKTAMGISLKHIFLMEKNEAINSATGQTCDPAAGEVKSSERLGDYNYSLYTGNGFVTGFGRRGGGVLPYQAAYILQRYRKYDYM